VPFEALVPVVASGGLNADCADTIVDRGSRNKNETDRMVKMQKECGGWSGIAGVDYSAVMLRRSGQRGITAIAPVV
jgi:hypothetical protein